MSMACSLRSRTDTLAEMLTLTPMAHVLRVVVENAVEAQLRECLVTIQHPQAQFRSCLTSASR